MKISDYIMEQEISTASCDDIEIERCFAEMEVLGALVDCYIKHEIFQEYCSDEGRSLNIFQESDESVKENGDTVKQKWYQKVLNFFKVIGQWFIKLFSRNNFESLKKKVEECPREANWTFSNILITQIENLEKLIKYYNDFGDTLSTKSTDLSDYKTILDDVNILEKTVIQVSQSPQSSDSVVLNKEQILEIINTMIDINNKKIPSVRKTLKNFEYAKKDYAEAANKKEVIEAIKECANKMHKMYVSMNKNISNMTNLILTPIMKGTQRAVKNEERAKKKFDRQQQREDKKNK